MTTTTVNAEPASNVTTGNSLKTRVLLSVLVLFLSSLWSLSYYASQVLRKDMQALVSEQQFSTVSAIANNLNEVIKDRFSALETVASGIAPSQLQHPAALQDTIGRLPLLKSYFNAGVLVYNLDGVAIADTQASTGRIDTNYMDIVAVATALRQGKSTVGSPVVGKKLQTPVFGMTVPIRDGQGRVIGALSGVVNLIQPNFVDRTTQNRYGTTGSYMLVAPKQRIVVTATDKSRVMELLPEPGVSPLMDRFFMGFEGSGVSKNPRGVEILASAKGIPATDWYLAAALPTAEAFAPIHNLQRRMWLVTGVLTLLAGVMAWWMIRHLLAPLASAATTLANMAISEDSPQPLAIFRHDEIGQVIGGFNRLLAALAERKETLKRSERKFLEILENVDANIYVKDSDGRYLFANRTMRRLCAVRMNEIIGQTDDALFDKTTVAQLQANDHRVLTEGITLRTDETVINPATHSTSTHLSVKLPLRNDAGEIYALCGISTDISDRKKNEEELRIAAIAFECQEGMVVLDHDWKILRVNHAFTQITGYAREEVEGKTSTFALAALRLHAESTAAWNHIQTHGTWQGDLWHKHKSGKRYLCRTNVTAVHDEKNQITHFFSNFIDATGSYVQEQERQRHEAAHRNALVREVHHRIKNNLQGITGLLHQFSVAHPETREPVAQAISQVRSVAVLHGLQGRRSMDMVRLCELTSAIAHNVQTVWQTPIYVDIPKNWTPGIVAETEAVPMALVINELMVNAVKHSSNAGGPVQVTLRKGARPDVIQISIHNTGDLAQGPGFEPDNHIGFHLVDTLMPRYGVTLTREQSYDTVITRLEVESPVIVLEKMELHETE